MKRRVFHTSALAGLGLLALPVAAKESKSSPLGLSFASPDAAIEHLVAALRDGDLGASIAAFDIERRVANYSFVKMAERLGSISLIHSAPPVRFPFYRDAARIQFTSEVAAQLRNLVYSLLMPQGTALDSFITPGASEDMLQVASDLEMAADPARLANLRILEIALPAAEMANSERHRRYITSHLGVTGGDDMQERVSLLELDGRTYLSGMTLVRYGDAWQARTMVAILAGTNSRGHAEPISPEDFANLP